MNKVSKLSFGISLLIYVYSCPAPTSVPSSIYDTNPKASNNSNVNPLSNNSNDNQLKPFSRPRTNPNAIPLPSSSASPTPKATATINTQPSGDTGTTSDSCNCGNPKPTATTLSNGGSSTGGSTGGGDTGTIERATFNGLVYDYTYKPINEVIVNAKSIDSTINWVGQTQRTVNGAYSFKDVPVGAKVEITIESNGITRKRTEIIKKHLASEPTPNIFDFKDSTALYYGTNLDLNLFNFDGTIYNNNVTARVESLNSQIAFSEIYNVNSKVLLNKVPANTDLRILITYGEKQKERRVTTKGVGETLIVNFGGTDETDKPFSISSIREKELDPLINRFINTNDESYSTFSVDTDTASYTLMRDSILRAGSLPSKDSVRLEEYVNYFDYDYTKPTKSKFSINTELAPSPFDKTGTKHIFRIGIQGQEIPTKNRKDSILTFLIDTSGSMADDNKLNNIKNSLKIMLKQLKPTDRVAIVEYNFTAKTVLKHTFVRDESKIVQAIDSLKAISTTDIEKGLRMAFKEAQESYDPDFLNRIILCSDGINSIEIKNPEELVKQIRKDYETKVSVSALGVGFTNYNDTFLEIIASKNDGYYSYIDNVKEAVRLFVESATDTLQVIAKDAKIQVEFNPKNVKKYRLVGYDNKVLQNQEFRNDNVDAGEIGSNHSVTAIYEVELSPDFSGKIANVNMRYKDINNNNLPLETKKEVMSNEVRSTYDLASPSFKKAATIALFGEILRESYWSYDNSFKDVLNYTKNLTKDDKFNEFINIVERSEEIITK